MCRLRTQAYIVFSTKGHASVPFKLPVTRRCLLWTSALPAAVLSVRVSSSEPLERLSVLALCKKVGVVTFATLLFMARGGRNARLIIAQYILLSNTDGIGDACYYIICEHLQSHYKVSL